MQLMNKENICQLIVEQLQAYGMTEAASQVADSAGISSNCIPSSRLSELVTLSKLGENEILDKQINIESGLEELKESSASDDEILEDGGNSMKRVVNDIKAKVAAVNKQREMMNRLDLAVTETKSTSKTAFATHYIATHKGAVRAAQFSPDGRYLATGSEDTVIKILDIRRMLGHEETTEQNPVSRTFYDHSGAINDLKFHPNGLVLASASKDGSIKFFDLTRPTMKRSFRYIQDAGPVRTIAFHPTGDYILAGTDQEIIRMYDIHTFQCFTTSSPLDHHRAPIKDLAYSPDGSVYASASADGSIKIWDGKSSACISTLPFAHGGAEMSCLQFSKSGKYLLSGGKDSKYKLWDTAMNRVVVTYEGATHERYRVRCTFNASEDLVLGADDTQNAVTIWDARTGQLLTRLLGHSKTIRCIASSPTDNAFTSCSDDFRVRYWSTDTPLGHSKK